MQSIISPATTVRNKRRHASVPGKCYGPLRCAIRCIYGVCIGAIGAARKQEDLQEYGKLSRTTQELMQVFASWRRWAFSWFLLPQECDGASHRVACLPLVPCLMALLYFAAATNFFTLLRWWSELMLWCAVKTACVFI